MTTKFDPKSCAVLANLALSRIRLHKNKRTEQGKVLSREVLGLLLAEKDDQARIRVVNVIHNDYYLDVLSALEVYLTVIAASTEVLAAQLSMPLEMKEAVCSICYAAPFLDNSPEIVKIRAQFAAKYHKDEDLLKTTFVNKKVLLGLSHEMPDDALINYYLSNILQEHSPSTAAPTASQAQNATPTEKVSTPPPASTQIQNPTPSRTLVNPIELVASQIKLTAQQAKGIIRVDNNSHFWVLPEDQTPPIFIPAQHISGSNDGDLVLVNLDTRKDGKRSGKIFRNLTVEASRLPKIQESTVMRSTPPPQASRLGMSALAARHFVGEAKGKLVIDSLQNAWVLDSHLNRPIFIPPIALDVAMDGDSVTIEVFEKNDKLIGKIKASTTSIDAPASLIVKPSPIKAASSHTNAKDPRFKENPILSNFPWKPVPYEEYVGLFKREDENLGMVLDEQDPLKTPVVVLGDVHRNNAKNGDRVSVLLYGQATNPTTQSVMALGQVLSILDHQPVSSEQPKTAASSSASSQASPTPPRPTRNVSLVPADSGDFVATLELDENGDACVLHPTLPWTYVIIPKSQLGQTCVGDEISIQLIDQKPSQGKMMGKLVGIVSAVDAYDVSANVEYETDDRLSNSSIYDGENSVELMESALATLNQFEPEPTSTADAQALPYPVLDKVIPSEVIVIDIGSSTIKVGYANQPVPILSIPTLTGRLLDSLAPQQSSIRSSPAPSNFNDLVVGKAAMDRRALLKLTIPFQQGVVSDWTALRSLLLGALTNLNMDIRRATVVIMESEAGNAMQNREQFAQILFDDFKLPFTFFARSSTCTLLSERKSSGIVVDIGHTSTILTAVEDGSIVEGSKFVFPLAGLDITSRLISLLEDDGYRMFKTESQKISAENVKIATAFVQTNPNPRGLPTRSSNYMLDDGTELVIGDQAWKCAEILFKPTLIGLDIGGLPQHINTMLKKFEHKPHITENIYLVGGSSLIPGLRQRLQNELQGLNPQQQIFIDHPSKAQYSAWIGGALLARLPDFKDCLLSREEYQSEGPSVVDHTFV